MQIYNDDCFNVLGSIEEKIDMVLVDLPYGQTDLKWDVKIDLDRMWKELKKICKDNCIYVFFTTVKFGNELINSNRKWFRYDLVWEKSRKVGFLSCNKSPLRKHEMIYIFSRDNDNDVELKRNIELRKYASKIKEYIGLSTKEIEKKLTYQGIDHFYRVNSSQFCICSKKTYNKLVELYKINEMKDFIPYEELKKEWQNKNKSVYNPQKTEGKPYKTKGGTRINMNVYGKEGFTKSSIDNKGDRYPHSILRFDNPTKTIHNTQKPIKLCEWLIKTYSNEGELVLDFTMGSGTTGLACKNTNRRFIGIEKDKEIFESAKKRLCEYL